MTTPLPIPLNEDTRLILGKLCMDCRPYAQMLRADGHEIPHKAEEEQAACIHWMLNLYLEHGNNWREVGKKYIEDHTARITAQALKK